MNIIGTATGAVNTGGVAGAKSVSEPSVSFRDIFQQQSRTENVNVGEAPLSAESRWQQIAGKYDVTNISTRERAAMTGELLENNLVSSSEGLALAAPYSMNENLDTKRDCLAISRDALAFSKQNGSSLEQVEA